MRCLTRFGVIACLAVLTGLSFQSYGSAAVDLPNDGKLDKVDFERHVMGLFGRMGCNSGSCHGSFQGKGGFRLSLFGYDPDMDYKNLTRDALGRRINPTDPDKSLILLKATGQVEHGGGRRFDINSWQYKVFRTWIVDGAPWTKGSGEVKAVKIDPPEYAFTKPGQSGQLKVQVQFADGSSEDMTVFSDYRVNDDAIVEAGSLGQVTSRRPGDTGVVVSYRGNVLSVRVMVPLEAAPGFKYPELPQNSYIEREVFAKLKRLNIVPSELAEDLEFLRRVTIDTIGCLPTPDEVRAFVGDKSADKRAKKIDELLQHPLHAALWATKFCDITGNNTDALENPQPYRAKRSQMWHDWFAKRVADNMPYDEIVKGVLLATSRDGQSSEEWIKQVNAIDEAGDKGWDTKYAEKATLDLFWRRQQNVTIDQWGEKTAAAFLGVRLECAQCHKHPFDRWTQADYRSYANIFGKVTAGISPEAKSVIDAENAKRREANAGRNQNQIVLVREMFLQARQVQLPHPDTNRPLGPKTLGGPELQFEGSKDIREDLFAWMRSPENPFFARSFVNRIWGHYLGVGIVDPVDDFSLANSPSNDKLLNALAKDFIEHKYDIRHMERTILNSRVYQLSYQTNATNRLDRRNYARSYIRPMMAEAVLDVLNTALGVEEDFGAEAPPKSRAVQVGASRLNNINLAYIFRIFGRPPRSTACDCERALDPALPQKLFLMSDNNLMEKMQKSRVSALLQTDKNDGEILEELFLATVSRFPTDDEKKHFEEYRSKQKDRRKAFVDTMWALINTREFILNH